MRRLIRPGIAACGAVIVTWIMYTLLILTDVPRIVGAFVGVMFSVAAIAATWLAMSMTEE